MEYYLVIERHELSSHGNLWRNLMCMLLSERSQSKKIMYCMSPNIRHSEKGKSIDNENVCVVRSWARERWTDGAQGIFRARKLFFMVL